MRRKELKIQSYLCRFHVESLTCNNFAKHNKTRISFHSRPVFRGNQDYNFTLIQLLFFEQFLDVLQERISLIMMLIVNKGES